MDRSHTVYFFIHPLILLKGSDHGYTGRVEFLKSHAVASGKKCCYKR